MRPIDADALLEECCGPCDIMPGGRCWVNDLDCDACREIVKAPTLTLADLRPKGRWITQDETFTKFMCSVCKSKNYGGYEKFCPNCGADMRGGSNG